MSVPNVSANVASSSNVSDDHNGYFFPLRNVHTISYAGHGEVEMGHEESGNIAIEDDDLGCIVLSESGHQVDQVILSVLIPQIDGGRRIVKGDTKNTRVKSCFETLVVGKGQGKSGSDEGRSQS